MARLKASMSLPVGTLFTSCFMIVLATTVVALRYWCRFIKKQRLRASDYSILLAWLIFIGSQITVNIGLVDAGLGQWQYQLSPDEESFLGKIFLAVPLLNIFATSIAKISAVFLLLEIFAIKPFRVACRCIQLLLVSYCVAFLITEMAGCRPIKKYIRPQLPGHCINYVTFYTVTASINAGLNGIVVLLPMPLLWGLRVSKRKRIHLICIFSLSLLVCGLSIARAIVTIGQRFSYEFPRQLCVAVLLATLETGFCIIVVCVPLLEPVAVKVSATYHRIFYSIEPMQGNTANNTMSVQSATRIPTISAQDRLMDHFGGSLFDSTGTDNSSAGSQSSVRQDIYNINENSGRILLDESNANQDPKNEEEEQQHT